MSERTQGGFVVPGYLDGAPELDVTPSVRPSLVEAQAWCKRLACLMIHWQATLIYLWRNRLSLFLDLCMISSAYLHRLALLNRLASKPRKPVAANRRGAKIGGP